MVVHIHIVGILNLIVASFLHVLPIPGSAHLQDGLAVLLERIRNIEVEGEPGKGEPGKGEPGKGEPGEGEPGEGEDPSPEEHPQGEDLPVDLQGEEEHQ